MSRLRQERRKTGHYGGANQAGDKKSAALSYQELQVLAKVEGIKANQSKAALIEALGL